MTIEKSDREGTVVDGGWRQPSGTRERQSARHSAAGNSKREWWTTQVDDNYGETARRGRKWKCRKGRNVEPTGTCSRREGACTPTHTPTTGGRI